MRYPQYACFKCRRTQKGNYYWPPSCPECSLKMKRMGINWKAPKRNKKNKWKIEEILSLVGANGSFRYWHSRPKTITEARKWL